MRKEIEIIANAPVRFGAKFQELVEYHSLITELSKRDLKARYTQTVLGLAWAFINPLVSVLLLYFVFTVVAKTNTAGVPPLLFVMSGLCIWNFFSRVVGDSGQSLLGAQAIVKKIYFPRLIIPLSKMLVGLVDLAIVLLFLLILLLVYQFPVSWNFLLIIPILLLAMLTSLAFGVWVSALNIRFRDFGQIVPILLRIGIFIGPIGYSLAEVPERFHWWYKLNPMTGLIEGFRSAVLGLPMDVGSLLYTLIITIVVLITGVYYFIRMDKYIGDIL